MTRAQQVAALRQARRVSVWGRASVGALLLLVGWAWLGTDLGGAPQGAGRGWAGLGRFLAEAQPWPMQQGAGVQQTAVWLGAFMGQTGIPAAAQTLALSLWAAVLAAILGTLLAPWAAQNLAHPVPLGVSASPPAIALRWGWTACRVGVRVGLLGLRAIPAYIWAFLLLAVLGMGPWPAILALVLHNTGILGRLNAELLEDADPSASRGLRAAGASRAQIWALALLPQTAGRHLLYAFVRWDSAVREATVLGMLGVVSLGWHLQQARAAGRTDELMLLIFLCAALVAAGDVLSVWMRRHRPGGPQE